MKLGPLFFLNPAFLILACVVLLFLVLSFKGVSDRKKKIEKFVSSSLWGSVIPELQFRSLVIKYVIWIWALFFLCLALARPQFGSKEQLIKAAGLDILFVFDVSKSMEAEDISPSRMKKAKRWIQRFIDQTRGDRVGIVSFAGSAHLECPLTNDLDYVKEVIEGLDTRSVSNQGTDIGAAIETALRALDRGAEQISKADSSQPATRILMLISDGEDNENEIDSAIKKMKESPDVKFVALGVGTDKGGPIPVRDEDGQSLGYKKDRAGQIVLTKLNSESLKKLSSSLDGAYYDVTLAESEMSQVLSTLGSLARGEMEEKKVVTREDRYQWPLAVVVVLLLVEFAISLRKKIVMNSLLMVLLVLSHSSVAQTDIAQRDVEKSSQEGSFNSKRENQKAVDAFKKEDLELAGKHLDKALELEPGNPLYQFNRGNLHLKKEDYESAKKAYEGIQGDLKAKALFNHSHAELASKNPNQAIQDLSNALRNNKDPQLELDIRKNIELIAKQQKNSGGGGSDQKEQSKDSNSKEQQKQDEKSGQSKDQEKQDSSQKKQYQQTPKREFKSQKLGKEDAERVMSELAQKEKELQNKMKKQKGRPQSLEKDW